VADGLTLLLSIAVAFQVHGKIRKAEQLPLEACC